MTNKVAFRISEEILYSHWILAFAKPLHFITDYVFEGLDLQRRVVRIGET